MHPSQSLLKLHRQLSEGLIASPGPGDQHIVEARLSQVRGDDAGCFPQSPADPVANDRVT